MEDDSDYFAHREEAALRLAEQANDPAVRHIHLAMAAAYRRRLTSAREEIAPQRMTGTG